MFEKPMAGAHALPCNGQKQGRKDDQSHGHHTEKSNPSEAGNRDHCRDRPTEVLRPTKFAFQGAISLWLWLGRARMHVLLEHWDTSRIETLMEFAPWARYKSPAPFGRLRLDRKNLSCLPQTPVLSARALARRGPPCRAISFYETSEKST